MPPEIAAILPPRGRSGARAYLESKGIMARVPTIRSRDFALVNTCRFLFYLTRRLSLASPFKATDALRHGSWFHTRFEGIGMEAPRLRSFMQQKLKAREDELRAVCKVLDIGAEATALICANEREDCMTTWAWYEAAAQFRRADIPQLRNGFEAYFESLQLRSLGKELRLCLNHKHGKKNLLLVAQLDDLLYNPKTNLLWILDAKTTALIPTDRAATMPCEFQPRHFSYILNELLLAGIPQREFGLPADVRFGGFLHLIVQKPAIRMGQKDRPYCLESKGLRKKMKGRATQDSRGAWLVCACDIDRPDWPAPSGVPLQTEEQAFAWLQEQCGKQPDRVYTGEPSFANYRKRCVDWYNGSGEYIEDRPKRESSECPVNISTMPATGLLDDDNLHEYLTQLSRVCDFATCDADPANFDRTPAGMDHADLAPFYITPPALWPSLLLEKRLLQQHWDEDLHANPNLLDSPTIHQRETKHAA